MKLQFTVRIDGETISTSFFFPRFSLGISRSVNRPTSQLIGEERSKRSGGEGAALVVSRGRIRDTSCEESIDYHASKNVIVFIRNENESAAAARRGEACLRIGSRVCKIDQRREGRGRVELIARRERGGQPIEPDTRDWKKAR